MIATGQEHDVEPDPKVDEAPAPDLGDQLDIPPTEPAGQPSEDQPMGGTGGVGAGGAG